MDYITKPIRCDLCKVTFNADFKYFKDITYRPLDIGYAGNDICINLRKKGKRITLNMCPECTEKLLELLDKHFPRLNLEDEL